MNREELERYARHIVLAEVGGPGQGKLGAARVLVVGAGGLGSPVIQYLAAAGVGTLRVVDDDIVALSNLQRQVLHATADVGRKKVASAADAVARLNPHVRLEPRDMRFTEATAEALLDGCDVVADGSDNPATRYAVADACERAGIPLVSAAVNGFDGHVTTLTPYERRPDGTLWPSYRSLFPDPPPDALVDECARTGILGVVTGIIGTLQANEVLKLILGLGTPLRGTLLMFDARDSRFETIRYARPG
ncbi:HesA/MoeB/ThiF family protein [Acuticoccus mangrovi]|uniref:Molybdopterin-synthase adenylyltransferase n=1 Tax=Acuticoccus mangrovi TaxID=2796142 RepID=A0A934IQP2_9HYPH|nr:HesA/MoeB/ThiF family protein [Acuticoccus mangrovi]MBJ3776946.1 HesA/MoeB/ThiF family protein [Acuticoccus mangrovi]